MKSLTKTTVVVLAMAVASAAAAEPEGSVQWLAVADVKPGSVAHASVVHSSDSGQEVAVTVPGVAVSAYPAGDGNRYSQLSIAGCGATAANVGSPEMPFKGFFVEIPYGVDVSVEVPAQPIVSLGTGYRVHPMQPPLPDNGYEEPAFEIDEQAYATDAFFPAEPVLIDDPGFIRGRRVVFVHAFPLRYNPVTTELQAFVDLHFNLVFTGEVDPAGEERKQRLSSPEFEALSRELIVNYEPVVRSIETGPRSNPFSPGVDYLIIVAHDPYDWDNERDLVDEIQPLADWKHLKGYRMAVTKWNIGRTASELKRYIQAAYDNWNPAPSYVLLVGDKENMPLCYHPGYNNDLQCSTDQLYACVDGNDYYPDLVIGRLPTLKGTECTAVVNKILQYERFPADEDWYDDFLSAGYFQDNNNDGEADRWFMETSAHVTEFLGNNGMTTHTAWCTNSGTHSSYHYRSDGYKHRFTCPDPVPTWVTSAWTSEDQAKNDIRNTINDGVGLVLHRDHGHSGYWDHPYFTGNNVLTLANEHKTPVVLSINCFTGAFNFDQESLCERFLEMSPGGAVGTVGATRKSYSKWNDLLTHGIFASFWPSYDLASYGSIYPRSWRPAAALNYGKYYMQTYMGTHPVTESEFHMFHWLGDPEMMLRTKRPQNLQVSFSMSAVGAGGRHILFTVTTESGSAVKDARVAITHPSWTTLLWSGLTEYNGQLRLSGVQLSQTTGYTLAVTAHDFRPYLGALDVPGACCDDTTGVCQDDMASLSCTGRWTPGLCADLTVACGKGACCHDDGTCTSTSQGACNDPTDRWLGYGVHCDLCDLVICPPDATPEGETCGEVVNNGCGMPGPGFEPIGLGGSACGTVWAVNDARDTDWYQLNLPAPQRIIITLGAESPTVVGVIEQEMWGQTGCDNLTGSLAWFDTGEPGSELSAETMCLPAGSYYLFVAPDTLEGYPCDPSGYGNGYLLTVDGAPCEMRQAACCDDDTAICEEVVDEVNCQGDHQRFLPMPADCGDFFPPCGTPPGVCCDSSKQSCEEDVYELDCQDPGRRYLPHPFTCDDFEPPCETPWGVCCRPTPGECTPEVYEFDCWEPDSYFLGAPASCDDCETAVPGACCDRNTGACEESTYEVNCADFGMRFLEDGTCGDFDPPCEQWGACCNDEAFVCEEGVYEAECQSPGMRFLFAPSGCEGFDPPCDYGGCCLPDDTCEMLVPDDCVNSNGIPKGYDTGCTEPQACCLPNGICAEVDPLCCGDIGGVPFPYGEWTCLGDLSGNGIDDACEVVPAGNMVVCEPHGGQNPTHPSTYWYDVTPVGAYCDFHTRVYDPNPGNYTGWVAPTGWTTSVQQVDTEWWASWWDPTQDCQNAVSTYFRFQFENSNSSAWGDWTMTIGNSPDPYDQVVDSSAGHAEVSDGYGHRVHVPQNCQFDVWQNVAGVWKSDAQWGDFDGDGDPDLVIAGETGGGALVTLTYENQSGALVAFPNPELVGVQSESSGNLAWGDYDGDGDLDLAVAGMSDQGELARIYENDGVGGLTWDSNQVLTGVRLAAVAWGDHDNDGDLDLVITGNDGTQRVSILYENDPLGTLTSDPSVSLMGVHAGSADWADWDGDGDLDLLLTGHDGSDRRTIFYKNEPVGTLIDDGDHGLDGVNVSDAAWGDYDGDGDLDLAFTGELGSGGPRTARVYENDGAGNLTEVAQPMSIYRSSAAWGDYDNDGDLDLALCGYDGSALYTRIYEKTGSGLVHRFTFPGVREGSLNWTDVDQDGNLDLFMTGADWSAKYAKLYKNVGCRQNTGPSPPTDLGCEQTVDGLHLTWSGASDEDTPDTGLYYCLRVGTSSGADDVVSGTYGTPLMGNVGQGTELLIDVPSGTYFSAVRTIDSGLMTSAWSSPEVACPGVIPPLPEPAGPVCEDAGACTGAYEGADCVAGTCYVPKNRYLSIDPTTNAGPVAYEVELAEATDYPGAEGRTWWVDTPVCYDYPNGNPVLPPPATCDEGPTRFGWVSKLTSAPVTRTWTETPLYIGDCGIVPVVAYRIRASANGGASFSGPLAINTAHDPDGEAQSWGDVTGGPVPGMPGLWLPPEGAMNFSDIGNAIRTFENSTGGTGRPPLVWVDMEINQVVNLGDIQFLVSAFEGSAYADLQLPLIGIHPADCP